MALKAMLKNLEGVSDAHKPLYKKQGEGDAALFILDVEPQEGWALENVTGLKTALENERETVGTLKAQVKATEGIDPVKAREALEKVESMKSWSSDDKVKEQVEQHGKAVAAEKDAIINQLKTQNETFRRGYEAVTVEQALIDAATDAKFLTPKLAPKLFRDSVRLEEREGKLIPVVIGPDGKAMKATNNDGTQREVTIKEFVAKLAASDEYAPLVAGNNATGTRGPGQTGNPNPGQTQQTEVSPHVKRQQIDNDIAAELLKSTG